VIIPAEQLELAGLEIADWFVDWSWVIRRVERLEFYDDVAYRRTVDVHFSADNPPTLDLNGQATVLLPFTLLAKDQVTNLDYTDGAGHPLSVLTSRDSGHVAAGILFRAASGALRSSRAESADAAQDDELLSLDVMDALRTMATTSDPREAARQRRDFFTTNASHHVYATVCNSPSFQVVSESLASAYPIVLPLDPKTTGARSVVRFSHDGSIGRTHQGAISGIEDVTASRRARVGQAVAWSAHQIWIAAPSVGRGGTYHLVAELPYGLKVTDQALLNYAPTSTDHFRRLDGMASRGTTHRIRLYARDTPQSTVGVATAAIRARAAMTVRAAALAAAGVSIVLAFGIEWAPTVAQSHTSTEAAGTLLLLVPTTATGLIARSSEEHALTTRLLGGVRMLSLLTGLLSFLGAGVIVTANNTGTVRHWFIALCLCSLLPLAALLRGLRASASSRDRLTTESVTVAPRGTP
jgi:hypothetical protein